MGDVRETIIHAALASNGVEQQMAHTSNSTSSTPAHRPLRGAERPARCQASNVSWSASTCNQPAAARAVARLLLEEEALGGLARAGALGVGELLALAVLLAVVLLGVAAVRAARGDLASQALQVLLRARKARWGWGYDGGGWAWRQGGTR